MNQMNNGMNNLMSRIVMTCVASRRDIPFLAILIYQRCRYMYVHTYIHITLFSSKMSLSLLVLIFTSILYKNKKSGPSLLSVSR